MLNGITPTAPPAVQKRIDMFIDASERIRNVVCVYRFASIGWAQPSCAHGRTDDCCDQFISSRISEASRVRTVKTPLSTLASSDWNAPTPGIARTSSASLKSHGLPNVSVAKSPDVDSDGSGES